MSSPKAKTRLTVLIDSGEIEPLKIRDYDDRIEVDLRGTTDVVLIGNDGLWNLNRHAYIGHNRPDMPPNEDEMTHDRPTRSDVFSGIARIVATRSTCSRRNVGCIIVQDERIIASGYNGAPPGLPHCSHPDPVASSPCQSSVHAEANAIAWAARRGVATEGGVMYCTDAPCYTCAQLILSAGIKEVYYIRDYRLQHGVNLLEDAGIVCLAINEGILRVGLNDNGSFPPSPSDNGSDTASQS